MSLLKRLLESYYDKIHWVKSPNSFFSGTFAMLSDALGSSAFIYANEEIDNLLGIHSGTVKAGGGGGGVEKGSETGSSSISFIRLGISSVALNGSSAYVSAPA